MTNLLKGIKNKEKGVEKGVDKVRKIILAAFVGLLSVGLLYGVACAAVTGVCSNCHTMHNSQNGVAMATYGGGSAANEGLTRGSCLGCHAYATGESDEVVTLGTSSIPQVWHADKANNLAGGNFVYIYEAEADTKGHNVVEINSEGTLTVPPGDQHTTGITNANFTCGGQYGCHGDRTADGSYAGVKSAHHAGISGQCSTASTVANSYRFLKGVKGFENSTWKNTSSTDHNEYFGATSMGTSSSTSPASYTISGLCAECHGNFHGTTSSETGGTASPWKRHPTDIALYNSYSNTEFQAYDTYSTEAPVARTTVPSSESGTVADTDIVMCLSCHGAHATNYSDILRWDYTTMIAGDTSKSGGCFTCHTTKND